MKHILIAVLSLCLAGCASTGPRPATICTTQPGSYACQVEQYANAGM